MLVTRHDAETDGRTSGSGAEPRSLRAQGRRRRLVMTAVTQRKSTKDTGWIRRDNKVCKRAKSRREGGRRAE